MISSSSFQFETNYCSFTLNTKVVFIYLILTTVIITAAAILHTNDNNQ